MIDIARNIVPCSDKQDMKSRNGSYFQPSFSTRKRQRISSDLFSELPQKRSKTTIGRIWNKATYFYSSQTLCTIFSKVIRMWASFTIFASRIENRLCIGIFKKIGVCLFLMPFLTDNRGELLFYRSKNEIYFVSMSYYFVIYTVFQ